MSHTLKIILSPTSEIGVYQAQGCDPEGNPVARHTFRCDRTDLLSTQLQLGILKHGATRYDDRPEAQQLLSHAEDFGRDLYERLFASDTTTNHPRFAGWRWKS